MLRLLLMVLFSAFHVNVGEDSSRQCNSALGVADGRIPNHRITSSSTYHPVRHAPHLARLNASDKTQGWCSHVKSVGNEYLEIDLGRNLRLTAVGTEGVYVKDPVTGRLNFTYVKEFGLSYRRNGEKRWRSYMEDEVSITLFKIDANSTRGITIHRLSTPRTLRYLRIAMDEGLEKVHERWCMRVEVYGCKIVKQDGLLSYKMSQGEPRSPGIRNFRDIGYDGTRLKYGYKLGVLSGGLGQLSDGVLGKNANWNDTNDTEWESWVGWRDRSTNHPTVTFRFDTWRVFSSIRFHVVNHYGNEKLLFGKLVVSFSNDGEYYSWKVVYEPGRDKRMDKDRAFWIEVDTMDNVGKFVTCDFLYYGYWILLSEVEFVSRPFINGTEAGNMEDSTVNTNTDDIVRKIRDEKQTPFVVNVALLASLLSVVTLAALLLFLGLLYRRRKRKQRAQRAMELFNNRIPVRIVNPSAKKNSLNKRNDQDSKAMHEKAALWDECDGDMDRDLEMEEMKLRNNRRKASLQEELIKDNKDSFRNLRPESKEISIEEEKAEVLAGVRKLENN